MVIEEIFPPNWKDHVTLHPRNPASFTPTREEGKYLLLGSDDDFNRSQISKFSEKDAAQYAKYEAAVNELADMISPFIDE